MRPSSLLLLSLVACSQAKRDVPQASSAINEASAAPSASTAPAVAGSARYSGPCESTPDVAIFTSPEGAWSGAPLRVIAVSEKPIEGELVVQGPNKTDVVTSRTRRGGPPSWWFAEVASPSAGTWRAVLSAENRAAACVDVAVGTDKPALPRAPSRFVWPVVREWNRSTENLYSAWIEKLFDAAPDEQPSWPALHEVLRDPRRNALHDHFGAGEDDAGPNGLVVDPDCADLPYFLRAYFSFKLGLPFGFSACSRGEGGSPPHCFRWSSNLRPPKAGRRRDPIGTFGAFLRLTLADSVHSGTGRTLATDDKTDYYPVPLRAESLRPGAVFADPYGHVLVVAHRDAQTATSGGALFAVDGQPDGTIGRKRFWRGNFLFALDPALGSPGFKRFRPIVVEGGKPRALTNAEIARHPVYGDWSTEQYESGVEGFYDKVDDVLSPAPLDPVLAMKETIVALEEQVKTRVLSVQNGVKYMAGGGATIDMPEDAAIFETTGPWEDFSTPSRDLRLLIAIDVVRGFADRVARRPERYAMPAGKSATDVKAELVAILETELRTRRFSYGRTDGSSFELTLADVVDRARDLEMAYNPNDCVETRWGAKPGSDEARTCLRRAPGDQQARMRRYRPWFHDRRRPPRQ